MFSSNFENNDVDTALVYAETELRLADSDYVRRLTRDYGQDEQRLCSNIKGKGKHLLSIVV